MGFHTDFYYVINVIGTYIQGLLYGAGCPVGGYFFREGASVCGGPRYNS